MTPDLNQITRDFVDPALVLFPDAMDSRDARVMILATGLQESNFEHMIQMGGGPAHSYWQDEKWGAVNGVLTHPKSSAMATEICRKLGVVATPKGVYGALATNQVLGAAWARLLLWTDPFKLPTTASDGWQCYLRLWNPGKPHPLRWPKCWAAAQAAVPTK